MRHLCRHAYAFAKRWVRVNGLANIHRIRSGSELEGHHFFAYGGDFLNIAGPRSSYF